LTVILALWRAIARRLPHGQILIVLPEGTRPQRKTVEKVVDLMLAQGHRVTTLRSEQLVHHAVKP